MADDRYLEGDPAAPLVATLDLSEFVQVTAQECQLIADLIADGRQADARAIATNRARRANALLHTLEVEPLPEVDIDATPDVSKRQLWRYRSAEGRG